MNPGSQLLINNSNNAMNLLITNDKINYRDFNNSVLGVTIRAMLIKNIKVVALG